MPLDVLEAGLVGLGRNGAAPRRGEAQGLELDLMVKALQRDDPLRRSFLQRRWQEHLALVPGSRKAERRKPTSLATIVLSRR